MTYTCVLANLYSKIAERRTAQLIVVYVRDYLVRKSHLRSQWTRLQCVNTILKIHCVVIEINIKSRIEIEETKKIWLLTRMDGLILCK